MKRIQRWSLSFLAVTFLAAIPLAANGLNMNGMGSRAMGMAGAVIAWTSDISLFFFNPAGATNAKDGWISIFETNLIPTGTYKLEAAMIDTQTVGKVYPAGAVGFIKPLSDKFFIGLGVFTPSGTGATWDGEALKNLTLLKPYTWESFLAVISIAPLVAYRISDQFCVGATMNIDYATLTIKRPALGQFEESTSGWAVGATIGMQYHPSDKLSFGLSVKLPISVTLKGDATMGLAEPYHIQSTSGISREATLPLWIGAGVSFKPLDKLRIALDVNWTNWAKLDKIDATYDNTTWNIALQLPVVGDLFNQNLDLRWKDCIQVRVGAEYSLSDCWAVRVGYMSDPSPAPLETMNILLPQIPFNVITIGGGYAGKKFGVHAALEILMGSDQTVPQDASHKMPGVHGMSLLVPNIQITYQL